MAIGVDLQIRVETNVDTNGCFYMTTRFINGTRMLDVGSCVDCKYRLYKASGSGRACWPDLSYTPIQLEDVNV